jgi:anthranilate synthase
MGRYNSLALVALVAAAVSPAWSFAPRASLFRFSSPPATSSTTSALSEQKFAVTEVADPNYNAVHVAKTGGAGTRTASQDAMEKNLSLGAPGKRPVGGHFLTKGGVQVTAQVDRLVFDQNSMAEGTSNRAVEDLVDRLDGSKGALLTSSYEFPGR